MRRFVHTVAALLALALGALLVPTSATGATPATTHLCQGYSQCEQAGWSTHGYDKVYKEGRFWNMNAGTNCANYAAYMLTNNGRMTAKPEGTSYAENWARYAEAAGATVSTTPRVGDIAHWDPSYHGAGVNGHVGYVERVDADGSIIISHDSFNKTFAVTKMTRASGLWPSDFITYPRSDGSPDGRLTKVSASKGLLVMEGWLTDPDRVTTDGKGAKIAIVWAKSYAATAALAQTQTKAKRSTTSDLYSRFVWNMRPPKTGLQYVTIYGYNQNLGRDVRLGTYQVNIKK